MFYVVARYVMLSYAVMLCNVNFLIRYPGPGDDCCFQEWVEKTT